MLERMVSVGVPMFPVNFANVSFQAQKWHCKRRHFFNKLVDYDQESAITRAKKIHFIITEMKTSQHFIARKVEIEKNDFGLVTKVKESRSILAMKLLGLRNLELVDTDLEIERVYLVEVDNVKYRVEFNSINQNSVEVCWFRRILKNSRFNLTLARRHSLSTREQRLC